MDRKVPVDKKAIPEGTDGYSGMLRGEDARTSESREARAKQQGRKKTAAGKVEGRHPRETSPPCLWPALQGHQHLCPGHNGICIFKQACLCEDKCIPSPVINPSHRPCSTNQVSGAPSLLCHPLTHTHPRICKITARDN